MIAQKSFALKKSGKNYSYLRYSNDSGGTFTPATAWVETGEYGNGRNLAKGYSFYTEDSPFVHSSKLNDGYTIVPSTNTKFFLSAGEYRVSVKTDGVWVNTHGSPNYVANCPNVTIWLYRFANIGDTTYTEAYLIPNTGVFNVAVDGYYMFRVNNYSDGVATTTHSFWDFKVELGKYITPWLPAPEDCLFGLTEGTYLGSVTWDKPYPPLSVEDYSWSKIVGDTGNGISGIQGHFAINASGTTAPTTWQSTPLAPTLANKYLWYYDTITYTDGTTQDTTKRVIGTYGDTGAPGATGVGISSIVNYYLASTAATGVTAATAGWTTTIQSITSTNKYLWSYTKITYTNSSTTSSTPVIIGVYGDKGADAENYELSVVTESAMIERTKTSDNPLAYSDKLTIALSYKVMHTKGSIIDYVNAAAGAYHIKVRGNNGVPVSTEFSVGANPNYNYTLNDYSTKTNKPTQLIVELYNNTTLVETRVVPIVLKADSWIEQDAQHIALINQSAQSIASLTLANGALTQRIETLRNGVRNLIDFGDVKTTFGSTTGPSAHLWDSWTKLVTLKANTTYTLTVCGCPSQGTVNAGGYMPVAVYGGTGNAFWKSVEFTSSTKEIKSVTFSTSDSTFPADGVLTFNAFRSGGTGGSTQTCYLDWIVITEGSIPASDYFSDVETRLENGNFIVNANTIIERLLIAANALVGASVFNGNYQFSQYGQDGTRNYQNFDPNHPFDAPGWKSNLVIDFLNGIFMASKGNVMFNQDGSGYLAGSNISWDANGNLDIAGKVHSSLFYGDTIYTSSIVGTPHQINLNVNPATTFIINTDNPYTILPSISTSGIVLNVELTFIFDPTSGNGAKLQAYSNENFRLYVGGNTKIFNNISGKGWIKLKAMSLTDGNFWVLIGVGGTLTTNVSGVNHTFTADSYV